MRLISFLRFRFRFRFRLRLRLRLRVKIVFDCQQKQIAFEELANKEMILTNTLSDFQYTKCSEITFSDFLNRQEVERRTWIEPIHILVFCSSALFSFSFLFSDALIAWLRSSDDDHDFYDSWWDLPEICLCFCSGFNVDLGFTRMLLRLKSSSWLGRIENEKLGFTSTHIAHLF